MPGRRRRRPWRQKRPAWRNPRASPLQHRPEPPPADACPRPVSKDRGVRGSLRTFTAAVGGAAQPSHGRPSIAPSGIWTMLVGLLVGSVMAVVLRRITMPLAAVRADFSAFCAVQDRCEQPGSSALQPPGSRWPASWGEATRSEPVGLARRGVGNRDMAMLKSTHHDDAARYPRTHADNSGD